MPIEIGKSRRVHSHNRSKTRRKEGVPCLHDLHKPGTLERARAARVEAAGVNLPRRRNRTEMDRSRLSRFVNQPLNQLPLDEPAVVSPFTTVRAAVSTMQEGSRSCVVAVDEGNVVGIFTERDVLTRCMADGFDWDQQLGEKVLTRNPRTIASNRTIAEAVFLMQQHHYRTLPVMENGSVVGLVRLGELVRHLAEEYPEDVLNLPPRPHQVMERPEGG